MPLERHDTTHLNCQYHSSTKNEQALEFRWSMNSTQEAESVDFPKSQFTSEKDSSVLAFSAKTDMDFGTTITCLATDAVGQTSQPCTFQIVRKGANIIYVKILCLGSAWVCPGAPEYFQVL